MKQREEWRTDAPDWRDDQSDVEVLEKDGAIRKSYLDIADVDFDGEDEYPVWYVQLLDGSELSLWHFEGWRFY